MKLQSIALDKLSVSKANMRFAKKAPDVSDILPTVRQRGVLVPLLVRPGEEPGHYEIVAGARRFHAASLVAEERRGEGTEVEALPCAVLDERDDAAAIEASLIENVARRDPDEVSQWETFTRLVREGRASADLATTFGLTDLAVRRILALGNLLPRLRDLYRREAIDPATVRHLTMASKARQREWLALFDDPQAHAPKGQQLKSWLFGGSAIKASAALFDLDAFGGTLVGDLFGEDRYFADTEAFWAAQQEAVEARRASYLAAGWSEVVVVPTSEHFHHWEYEKAGKRKGGRVYIDLRASGEVTFHEGYISRAEARRIERGDQPTGDISVSRPEISGPMQDYVDLHRHAAVRALMTRHQGLALRLMVAHAIAGSPLWSVRVEPRTARREDVCESIEGSRAEAEFDKSRRAALLSLGLSDEELTLTRAQCGSHGVVSLFLRLLTLDDATVMDLIPVVMGETLQSGSALVEAVGRQIHVDMADHWQADSAFFENLRDREVLLELVAEVAGPTVASANIKEKSKSLKGILRDYLNGEGGREQAHRWVPRWMRFPPSAYTGRGGINSVTASACLDEARVERDERITTNDARNTDVGPALAA